MFYGNLIALVQKHLKRLLGFSGIAHAGYAMIGFRAPRNGIHRGAVLPRQLHLHGARLLRGDLPASRPTAATCLDGLAGLHRPLPRCWPGR